MSITRVIGIFLFSFLINACQTTKVEPPPVPDPASSEATTEIPLPVEQPEIEEPPPVDQNRIDYLALLETLKKEREDVTPALQGLAEKAPELEFIFTNLGLAYFKKQNYQQAKTAFERAISLNKSDAVAYNHLGIISRLNGAFSQSRIYYEKAISSKADYAPAYLNLGILLDIYIQDLAGALALYKKYQMMTNNTDKTVSGWITDLERRLKAG